MTNKIKNPDLEFALNNGLPECLIGSAVLALASLAYVFIPGDGHALKTEVKQTQNYNVQPQYSIEEQFEQVFGRHIDDF
ncbi:hypothetical protein HOE04_05495 [archaeon]|jgi:hypothetical protein|nr:hypothetical protein [archaeon]